MTRVYAHARAVLPDRVIEDALVVTEDGVITDVAEARPGAVPAEATDLRGALLLPGLVDTHSDGLEKELNPRPNAEFDVDFAVASFEGRVRAAGVTTIFHGVGYQSAPRKGRDLGRAVAITEAIRRRAGQDPMVDHRFLFRLDARDPEALAALGPRLADLKADVPPLVSYEDHTPGQGQYRDPAYYRGWLEGSQGVSREQAQSMMDALVAERNTRAWHRPVALGWLAEQARLGHARVLAHDPVTAAEVADAYSNGVRVAEFPTTVEAARAARELGMDIVAGAPNVLRGGSHSGNVAAVELISADLADALSSDYMPSAMLAAALRLAGDGVVPLPRAVALVTSGPARVAGLDDRGFIAPGARADLVAVTISGGWPTVRLVHRAADHLPAHRALEPSW
ncbi:alpha-D-ribose 1-methylphosphonate 5-triphosphate diphosphatase [Spongiactinospora sp. TRM90649]|uniref:alpha-D-ribose 1-methylphosphonate 5-triphosphate diphosphatase n=1 Tax=Spongiactinospora sp. TRM90649 TaxID=3031114 RepID=UPI0023F7C507|nr:alpha-D-ribose 1-methylphosphonate 5-triphosphate diphosphatase [Spongiactinospora sp. TRM90649]MDF5757068.1 alpha-D-ribose 1-methylphosphonate 5-triphosphate diphosphatase [Spongiactinospora sp. TRM90649]